MKTIFEGTSPRLHMLLRVRIAERNECRLALAAVGKSLDTIGGQLSELAAEMERLQRLTRRVTRPGSVNVNRAMDSYRYERLLELRQQQLKQREAATRQLVEAKRELVIHADREVRMVEKLLEQENQRRQLQLERAEQRAYDEIAHHRLAG